MNILWFTNNPMPAVDRHFGVTTHGSGYWMSALLDEMRMGGEVELAVGTVQPGREDTRFSSDGVNYYVMRQDKPSSAWKTSRLDLERCASVIKTCNPDLVHVHGTERLYGLVSARGLSNRPFLINMQGIHTEILRNWKGSMTLMEILMAHTLKELVMRSGPIPSLYKTYAMAKRQVEIIRGNRYFCGQTLWDEAHVWEFNPCATYFLVGRVLRPDFCRHKWDLAAARRFRVFFTNARSIIRGVETLIDAIALLRREFPEVSLALAGGLNQRQGYGKSVYRRIKKRGLEDCVEFLGYIDAERLVKELLDSHVFAVTSWTENESNSLCEAQLLAMPCLVSYAGGMPSMVEDGVTGLHFPPGDAGVLAFQIRKIFRDDDYAITLGATARSAANARHDPRKVVSETLDVYRKVLCHWESMKNM